MKNINEINSSINYNEIYSTSRYASLRGFSSGKFDKFLEFLDNQVILNVKLLNNKTISKPFINNDAVEALLLNRCKTQSDYHDLDILLGLIKDLGGIATGYYDACMRYLSKIHIKGMRDQDIQYYKEQRTQIINNINNELVTNPLYNTLNFGNIIETFNKFEENPSVQAKEELQLSIRYALSKCKNQEDFYFLSDNVERLSSHSLYTSTFVYDKNLPLFEDLRGNFSDYLLESNNRSIKIAKDMYKERYGVEVTFENEGELSDTQVDNSNKTDNNQSKDDQSSVDRLNVFKTKLLACGYILKTRKFDPRFPMFQKFADIENFVENCKVEIDSLKDSLSDIEYQSLNKMYGNIYNIYAAIKLEHNNKHQHGQPNNLLKDIEDFIVDTKEKMSGHGSSGMVEFDSNTISKSIDRYSRELELIKGELNSQDYNNVRAQLDELYSLVSYVSNLLNGM